jgi:hypothetical protein
MHVVGMDLSACQMVAGYPMVVQKNMDSADMKVAIKYLTEQ